MSAFTPLPSPPGSFRLSVASHLSRLLKAGRTRVRCWLASAGALALAACGGGNAGDVILTTTPSGTLVRVVVVSSGLSAPWGLAFLPGGEMLVTERGGQMRRVSADGLTVSAPISGLPPVAAGGQGGLLDVQIDPDFATTPWVYWSYAEPGSGAEVGLAGTAVARGLLVGNELRDVRVIFRQSPKVSGSGHFGSRLVFAPDKSLLITLGERQKDNPSSPTLQFAQNLGTHLGKVVRIARDGSLVAGNPDFGVPGAKPEIVSYGHRNPQAAALHPVTRELWLAEHGPQGGDEVNRVLPGRNYGWPLRSYGCQYGSVPGEACRVGGGTHAPDFEEPLTYWGPTSIAPSGMAFYTSNKHPDWQGNLFVGALAGQALWRLTLNGNTVSQREALFLNQFGRIRDVRQGPDGWLYLLIDSDVGRILRVER